MKNYFSKTNSVSQRALLYDGDDDGDFHGACDGRTEY